MTNYSIKKIQEHADELYKLVHSAYPDSNMFRAETTGDKAVRAAVWHSHEIVKYLGALNRTLQRAQKENQMIKEENEESTRT